MSYMFCSIECTKVVIILLIALSFTKIKKRERGKWYKRKKYLKSQIIYSCRGAMITWLTFQISDMLYSKNLIL